MQAYFDYIQSEIGIPVYTYNNAVDRSLMSALIPPRLEALFDENRARGGGFLLFPHALLIRDWAMPPWLEDCT